MNEHVRIGIYLFGAIGSAVVTYLAATGIIGSEEVALWTAIAGAIAALAGVNLRHQVKLARDDESDAG